MRTSLLKLQEIERHLLQRGNTEGRLLFEAQMIIDSELAENVAVQKNAYTLINLYGRVKLKAGLEAVHQQLFTQTKYQRFSKKIMALFK